MYRYFIIFLIFTPCFAFSVQAENTGLSSLPSELSREVSLKKLLEQFSYEDWRDWDHAFLISKGTPTLARYYIERVSLIDTELSKYLNASAYFFHLLYLRTKTGETFDLDLEIERAKSKFESEIIDDLKNDQVFSSFLENLRYEFTLKYVEQNISSNNLKLLAALDRTATDGRLYPRLIENINRLSLKASARYRKNFFENQDLLLSIKSLASKDLATKRSLANLFLLGVVDALERGEKAWAQHLFQQSKEVYPNFALQVEVAKFLEQANGEDYQLINRDQSKDKKFQLFQVKVAKKEQSKLTDRKASVKKAKAGGGSISVLFVVILFFFLIASLLVIVLYRRYVEQQGYKKNIHASGSVGGDAGSLDTIPGLDEFSSRNAKAVNS